MGGFTTGGTPGGGEPSPGPQQSPAVFDSVVAVLDDLFSAPESCPTPEKEILFPKKAVTDAYASVYCTFIRLGVWPWLAKSAATGVASVFLVAGALVGVILWAVETVGPPIAEGVLAVIDKARKDLDPQVAEISVLVLNELLGTELEANMLASGTDVESHIARAEEVGNLLHKQLLEEFKGESEIQPDDGVRAAKRFSGFLINFGTATAFLSLLGEMFSIGRFHEFRELGVEVARNLGLGRLHRLVMKPLIQTLISVPYQWSLNRTFHPTQFKVQDLVNPFSGAVMDHQTIFEAMDLAGYSEDKTQQLIELHQKRLTDADVERLVRYRLWTPEDGLKYLKKLGYPEAIAQTVFTAIELGRSDLRIKALLDTVEANFAEGHMSLEVLAATLDKLPLTDGEKELITLTAVFKQKAPHKRPTFSEMQQSFDQGLVTIDEFDTFLIKEGFSADDRSILIELTLLKFAKQQEADAERKKRKADREARAAARAARPPAPKKTP